MKLDDTGGSPPIFLSIAILHIHTVFRFTPFGVMSAMGNSHIFVQIGQWPLGAALRVGGTFS